MKLKGTFKELLRYPSAIIGLSIILLLIVVAVYAVVSVPYDEAVRLWRGGKDPTTGLDIWYRNPKYAGPTWTNLFRRDKLPETIVMSTAEGSAEKEVFAGDVNVYTMTFPFEFEAASFASDMVIFFDAKFTEKKPHVSMSWTKPDGTVVRVADLGVEKGQAFYFAQDAKLTKKLGGVAPVKALFAVDPAAQPPAVMKGQYKLEVLGFTFEPDSTLDAELIVYGQLAGIAGTDHLRRDLKVALLWGTPVALSFGLLAALGTTITTMLIAAIATWFGGWVDALIQRITQVNMVLPFLPILIMIGVFYSRSIFVILGATILLSIFGASILNYRSIFLQVKESGYIDAARAYGAGNWRVIFRYLLPKIIPMMIPALVTGIPAYVFLEASLAVLGLGDPSLPTWGKAISDAQANGALYQGLFYWVLEPAVLLILCGMAFALLGFSLDRIFNPRLRGQ
ncbi:MAG TPA: ABC transporter permease [Anaerolineae bacterium]|nr:ABC transporter permease [Anaerolineae bacterium]